MVTIACGSPVGERITDYTRALAKPVEGETIRGLQRGWRRIFI